MVWSRQIRFSMFFFVRILFIRQRMSDMTDILRIHHHQLHSEMQMFAAQYVLNPLLSLINSYQDIFPDSFD